MDFVSRLDVEGRGLFTGFVDAGQQPVLGRLYAEHRTYTGQWKNGAEEGFGKEATSDGIYQGAFSGGLRNGMGVLTMQGRDPETGGVPVRRGFFKDGVFIASIMAAPSDAVLSTQAVIQEFEAAFKKECPSLPLHKPENAPCAPDGLPEVLEVSSSDDEDIPLSFRRTIKRTSNDANDPKKPKKPRRGRATDESLTALRRGILCFFDEAGFEFGDATRNIYRQSLLRMLSGRAPDAFRDELILDDDRLLRDIESGNWPESFRKHANGGYSCAFNALKKRMPELRAYLEERMPGDGSANTV